MSKHLVTVVAAVFFRWTSQSGETLPQLALFRRKKQPGQNRNGAGFWEFPGGKIEPQETPEQALEREILEELAVQVKVGERIGSGETDVGDRRIHLTVHYVSPFKEGMDWSDIQFQLTDHDDFKWIYASEIVLEEISEPDRPLVELAFKKLIVEGKKQNTI